jgi:DNA mismatch repair protein MutS2
MGELKKQAEDVLRETESVLKLAEDLREGDIVWIENLREEGEILSQPDDRHKVWVLVNDMRMNLGVEGMQKLPKHQAKTRDTSFRHSKLADKLEEGIQPELDLRGMDAFQAIDATNSYLDQAIQNGWDEIRIIHGKGTGVLRREINNFLAHDERITNKRLGKWGEGDTGVTIVTLKREL